jgi:hypothetical protein
MAFVFRPRRNVSLMGICRPALFVLAPAVALLLACGKQANSGAATAQGTANSYAIAGPRPTTSYRFVKPPIVVWARHRPNPGQNIEYYIIARVNKPIPKSRGRFKGDLQIDSSPSEAGPARYHTTSGRWCYYATYGSSNNAHGAPQLLKPQRDQRVTVTLYFNKRKYVDAHVTAHEAKADEVGYDHKDDKYLRRLGCLP